MLGGCGEIGGWFVVYVIFVLSVNRFVFNGMIDW
jgi:hypothetical protein